MIFSIRGGTLLIGLFAAPVLSPQAVAQAWKVDSARAPTKLLDFTATEGTWISVDVAPDGQSLVFDLLGHLYEMPITGGEARPLTRGRSWNHFPRYSPDGTRILFTSDRSGMDAVWLLRRGTDSAEQVSKLELRTVQGAWSADGRFIYATTMDLGARFAAVRLDLYGSRTDLMKPNVFSPATQFSEYGGKVYFAQPGAGQIYQSGFQIKTYDLKTGEIAVLVSRPGGAVAPAVSRDGRRLAYVHRDDRKTVLVLHQLATGRERVLLESLDRDRQESGAGATYGAYPNLAWHPNNRELFLAFGGKIHAVDVESGAAREIPFRAPVKRELEQTIKFPVPLPVEGKARTRSHRWGLRTDQGVLFEALGDLYLRNGAQPTNLTNSPEHETSPAYDPATRTLFYAAWSDDSLGSIWSRTLGGRGPPVKLTTVPAQYGSLTLSPDGKALAFLRGTDELTRGAKLEEQGRFELILLGADRVERKVTDVSWGEGQYANFATKHPPGITFSPDGAQLYFTEFTGDSLSLKRIRVDGQGEETLYYLPHAVRALVSPDLKWIAFREYTRSFVTPFAFAGKPVTVTAFDKQGATFRVDAEDGDYTEWTRDGAGLMWTRGGSFYEKPLADVLANKPGARKTEVGLEYDVAVPSSTIALTHARVLTMDSSRRVLENATVVVRRNRIAAVGVDVAVPTGAKVYDLAGRTVMPGMLDAHAHYDPDVSPLHVVEQRHQGLLANLAYGTTTLYEVYGNVHKDFLVSDLQRKGAIDGARLVSVGYPIYGLRYYRPKLYRPILSLADAEEVVQFNKDHGATALKEYVQFNRSSRQQLYAAARKLGLNVVAESAVDFQMDWTDLIDGVSGIEHTVGLTPLYDDVIRLWAATAAGNTPTLIVVYNGPWGETYFHQSERLWEDPKLLRFFRQDELIKFRRTTHYFDDDVYASEMARELRKLHQAGVSLQVSGHGQMHGLDKHWDMELFTKGGFAPRDVLAFATIQSAKYLGLDGQLGSIEPGKLADLVILKANPLENIRNTRQIEMVMLNGALYRGEDAARLYPDPRPAGKLYFQR